MATPTHRYRIPAVDYATCHCDDAPATLLNSNKPCLFHYGRQRERSYEVLYMPVGKSEAGEMRMLSVIPADDDVATIELDRLFEALVSVVYPDGSKHITAFVSPASGKGQGPKLWQRFGLPILSRSRHEITTIPTTHKEHALQYCEDLNSPNLESGDVVVSVGGDGMVHEVINGLKRREQKLRSKQTLAAGKMTAEEIRDAERSEKESDETMKQPPIVIVDESDPNSSHQRPTSASSSLLPVVGVFPTGSACGLATGLDVLDVTSAALAIVHTVTVPLDLMTAEQATTTAMAMPSANHDVRITSSSSRGSAGREMKTPTGSEKGTVVIPPDANATTIWSFLSLEAAFIAELDKESEKWRWMGNARFTVYAVKRLLQGLPRYRCTVKYLPWSNEAVNAATTGDGAQGQTINGSVTCTGGVNGGGGVVGNGSLVSNSSRDWGQKANLKPKLDLGSVEDLRERCSLTSDCYCLQQGGSRQQSFQQEEPKGSQEDEENWVTLPTSSFTLLTLCRFGYLAKDSLMAPFTHVGDGAIDITYSDESFNRSRMAKGLLEMENGTHVNTPGFQYVKARKVLLEPHEGNLMIDGEVLPFHGYRLGVDRQGIQIIRAPSLVGHAYPGQKKAMPTPSILQGKPTATTGGGGGKKGGGGDEGQATAAASASPNYLQHRYQKFRPSQLPLKERRLSNLEN